MLGFRHALQSKPEAPATRGPLVAFQLFSAARYARQARRGLVRRHGGCHLAVVGPRGCARQCTHARVRLPLLALGAARQLKPRRELLLLLLLLLQRRRRRLLRLRLGLHGFLEDVRTPLPLRCPWLHGARARRLLASGASGLHAHARRRALLLGPVRVEWSVMDGWVGHNGKLPEEPKAARRPNKAEAGGRPGWRGEAGEALPPVGGLVCGWMGVGVVRLKKRTTSYGFPARADNLSARIGLKKRREGGGGGSPCPQKAGPDTMTSHGPPRRRWPSPGTPKPHTSSSGRNARPAQDPRGGGGGGGGVS